VVQIHKKPGLPGGRPGSIKKGYYFEDTGAGAGAGAGAVGQQEAARKETAAAATMNLTVVMMFVSVVGFLIIWNVGPDDLKQLSAGVVESS
jgi:hypothetical protein